jgi:pSer/pThr/pTyr-binding forkhead associated (FHA) protein
MSQLRVFRNGSFEFEHSITKDKIALGRHSENDVVLNDLTMSRFHARIERRAEDFVLVDLNAQNGVLLNGTKISGESTLTDGDRFVMGHFEIVFEGEDLNATDMNQKRGIFFDGTTDFDLKRSALTSDPGAEPSNLDSDAFLEDENFTSGSGQDADLNNPCFVLMYNAVEMERFAVKDELIVGRSEAADITIPLGGLSRRHARIYRENGQFYVEDNNSQNGTWVDFQRILKPRKVSFGTSINFYEYSLIYCKSFDEKPKLPDSNPTVLAEVLSSQKLKEESEEPLEKSSGTGNELSNGRSLEELLSEDLESQLGGSEKDYSVSDTAASVIPHANFSSEDEGSDTGFVFGAGSFIDEENLVNESKVDAPDDSESLISQLGEESFPEFENEQTMGEGSESDFGIGDQTGALDGRSRSFASELSDPKRGAHPTEKELDRVLSQISEPPFFRVEVYLDGNLYTQIPLSQPIVRLGTDARCELAIPRASDLRPWHLTLLNFGPKVICSRASRDAFVEVDGEKCEEIVLKNEDKINLGKITLVFKEG